MNNTAITLFGISFIFIMTVMGAAFVYAFKSKMPDRLESALFGFASGIMTAASVWSLLLPALSQAEIIWKNIAFLPVALGFLFGGILIALFSVCKKGRMNRAKKLFLSVTLHNIPEGLAVGFAFGAARTVGTSAAYLSALGLAVGVGVQNFPEGAAVSLPMQTVTKNRNKAFLYGVFSATVEPIFAVLGYFFIAHLQVLQPWLLAFSAGAMIFVVAEELLPETKDRGFGAWGVMIGFTLMMILDVALAK